MLGSSTISNNRHSGGKKSMVIMLFLTLFVIPVFAQGDLLLFPRRIVFEGTKQRIQELNLANMGKDTLVYAVSFSHIRMNRDGSFTEITKPDSGQQFADNFIRFFPHTVRLGPNESQVVKFQLTRTSDLKPGEYRSAIYFRALPRRLDTEDSAQSKVQSKTLSVKLIATYGISIPVIVLSGPQDVKVSLTDLSISRDKKLAYLNLLFHRTGNVSCYGDLNVVYTSPQGKAINVGVAKGVAVYTPNKEREAKIPLELKPGVDLHSGTITLSYHTSAEKDNALLAQTSISLH